MRALAAMALLILLQLAEGTVVRVAPVGTGTDTPGCGNATHPCATIGFAVAACPAGGTVLLLPGTHLASGASTNTSCGFFSHATANKFFDGVSMAGRNITILSDPPLSATVDCQNCGRAFVFNTGETAGSVVRDIKVRLGRRCDVGWCCAVLANIRLISLGLQVVNGYHGSGGCVLVQSSSPTIDNVEFTNCTASVVGSVTLPVKGGGAMTVYGSAAPTVTNSVFANNTSSNSLEGGSSVRLLNGATATFSNCTFIGGKSPGDGGAFFISSHTDNSGVFLSNCSFVENYAMGGGSGGAIAARGTGIIRIEDTVFARNKGESVRPNSHPLPMLPLPPPDLLYVPRASQRAPHNVLMGFMSGRGHPMPAIRHAHLRALCVRRQQERVATFWWRCHHRYRRWIQSNLQPLRVPQQRWDWPRRGAVCG